MDAATEAKAQVETNTQTLKAISNLERNISESIQFSIDIVSGFCDTLKIKSAALNRRVGGIEDLFQLLTNRLRDRKLEMTDGMVEITRSLNQLKLNIQAQQESREPDLRFLKTLNFSFGVESEAVAADVLLDLQDIVDVTE